MKKWINVIIQEMVMVMDRAAVVMLEEVVLVCMTTRTVFRRS